MANALRAINKRVNALQKKHPKTKRTTLQKQAGREWKAGKLGAKKKRKTVKRKTVRRIGSRTVAKKPHRRKRVGTKIHTKKKFIYVDSNGEMKNLKYAVVGKRKKEVKRKRYKPVKVTHCRRVGAKKGMNPLILIAGAGLLLYAITRPGVLSPATTLPPITLANPAAAASANSLVSYATAAGLAIPSIVKLINSLNSSPAESVISAGNGVSSGAMTIDQLLND